MLKGEKVYLCAVERSSIEQFRLWRNMPELRKYFREYRELSTTMQDAWYEKILIDKEQVNFEIRALKNDRLIGCCGLHYIDWVHRHAEFGIYIGVDKYRNGDNGSDALRTLIKFGFEDLNLNRIWCEVYENNSALDVYRHIGFKDEGTLRQTYYNEGRYWDSHLLSMLREEYEGK